VERRRLREPLESERLTLRMPRPEDAPAVLEALRESWAALHAWMDWAREVPTLAQQTAHLEASRQRFEALEDFPLFAFLRESGEFVGGTGLHRADWSVPRFEIGYWIRTRRQRRGLATEAVRAVSEAAFAQLGARRLEIRCHDRNEPSWRVAERAGFALEGLLRRERRHVDGTLRDTRLYARVR
jgi:RimJ/RimL family protein N-acetyltransferase